MTDGILLAETQHDRFLEQYQVLIIDEAHERSLNIDFLLGYIKTILPKRPDLKIIVTSATIDVQRFSDYFEDAPVLGVAGRTYPVEVAYKPLEETKSQDTDQQLYQSIIDVLFDIDIENNRKSSLGDVLVFLPGEREIKELSNEIKNHELNHSISYRFTPVYKCCRAESGL